MRKLRLFFSIINYFDLLRKYAVSFANFRGKYIRLNKLRKIESFVPFTVVANCKTKGEKGTERSLFHRRHRYSFVVGRARHNACKFPNTDTGAMHAEKKRNFGKREEKPGKEWRRR